MHNAEQKQCTNTAEIYCTASSDTFIGENLFSYSSKIKYFI